jgi:hypothetical protein
MHTCNDRRSAMLLDIARVGMLYQNVCMRLRFKTLCLRIQCMQQPITKFIPQRLI